MFRGFGLGLDGSRVARGRGWQGNGWRWLENEELGTRNLENKKSVPISTTSGQLLASLKQAQNTIKHSQISAKNIKASTKNPLEPTTAKKNQSITRFDQKSEPRSYFRPKLKRTHFSTKINKQHTNTKLLTRIIYYLALYNQKTNNNHRNWTWRTWETRPYTKQHQTDWFIYKNDDLV